MAESLADTLRQHIVAERYKSGSRLPPERQLATDFSTSRATVREALRLLERSNLVSRRLGSGTYVTFDPGGGMENGDEDVAEITSPLELVDVRTALEPHMVRLAVLNMTARDLTLLKQTLDSTEGAGANQDEFSHWDQVFHLRIAEATRNPLIIAIYKQINHVRGHAQWNTIKRAILTAERISEYKQHHRGIYEALRSRDAEAAAALITDHLAEARRDLTEARQTSS